MNLPLHTPLNLRPYSRVGKYCRPTPEVGLSRIALGAIQPLPHWPTLPCEFCWPPLITAMLYVDGRAACHCCAVNPNRVARMPRFAKGSAH